MKNTGITIHAKELEDDPTGVVRFTRRWKTLVNEVGLLGGVDILMDVLRLVDEEKERLLNEWHEERKQRGLEDHGQDKT